MSEPPPPPSAGWYPDWSSPHHLRWWDGSAWTDSTVPSSAPGGPPILPPPPGLPPSPPPDRPDVAVANEERVARLLRPVLVASAVGAFVAYGMVTWLFHDAIHNFVDELNEASQARPGDPASQPSFPIWIELSSLVTTLLAVSGGLVIVWAYLAAVAGRALDLPARRKPLWVALGFLIPVLNLWWPYQGVAGTLPRSERRSAPLRLWWTTHVAGGLLGTGSIVMSWWSMLGSGLLGLAAAATVITSYLCLRRIVATVATAHRRLLDPPEEALEAPRAAGIPDHF